MTPNENSPMTNKELSLDERIGQLLADPEYSGHPLREALSQLFQDYRDNLLQIEKITSISDGYHSVLHERNHSLVERYRKQLRQLHKIMRISDQYQGVLQGMNENLRIASMQDALTELPNRRFMLDRLRDETAAMERGRDIFSLAVLDIDHFKIVNDDFGHDMGDKVLVMVAQKLLVALRAYDICARWGGEEFLVLLPETRLEQAAEVAERLRLSVESLECDEVLIGMKFTVSIGVAQHEKSRDFSATLKSADRALYEAKDRGRNCIVLAP